MSPTERPMVSAFGARLPGVASASLLSTTQRITTRPLARLATARRTILPNNPDQTRTTLIPEAGGRSSRMELDARVLITLTRFWSLTRSRPPLHGTRWGDQEQLPTRVGGWSTSNTGKRTPFLLVRAFFSRCCRVCETLEDSSANELFAGDALWL